MSYSIYCPQILNRNNPMGIDQNPIFSWKLDSDENNVYQKSYQILVWEDDSLIWNSGKIESEATCGIVYNGANLKSGCQYTWQIISTNQKGIQASSEIKAFSTGKLSAQEWSGKWIKATLEKKPLTDVTDMALLSSIPKDDVLHPERRLDSPVYFRKDFSLSKKVKKATAYATALGLYRLSIDGCLISNPLAPEYTSYKHHLEYQTYDITKLMEKSTDHALGMIVSEGWYSGKIGLMGVGQQYGRDNLALFQLEIQYEDGEIEIINSDQDVRFAIGAYIYADLFVGEYIDFNKSLQGFDIAGYDDSSWEKVELADYSYDTLRAQSIDPVCVSRKIKPLLLRTPNGEWVLDAGENICGYTAYCGKTVPMTEVSLEHSEVLDKDGNFFQNITGQNKNQTDRFIAASETTTYIPQFTFHGFRYVKVTGLSSISPEDFTICVLESPLDRTGSFTCSDPRLNQLQENIIRSQQGNMVCIPTDCPQRERAGWTGDMEIYGPTATFNMDVQAFLRRWLYDMRKEQLADGQIPHVIPQIDSNKYMEQAPAPKHVSSAGWADACILVPLALYKAYGDKSFLKENYSMMKGWMQYIKDNAGDDFSNWVQLFHFGDWLIPSIMAEYHNPIITALNTKEEVALAYLAYDADCMTEIAEILDLSEDATEYLLLSKRVRDVFSKKYVSENGLMRQPLQGLYVLALGLKLLTAEQEKGALDNLLGLIKESNYTLDTGFLSVPFLLNTLCQYGANDVAYKILYQDDTPGWLYAVKLGATTIWENWAAILPDGTPTETSLNHFAFGCVGDFLYKQIGGLLQDDAGYKKIRIMPDYACGLDWAETSYDSIHGKIIIKWMKANDEIKLHVQLPPNTSGIIHLNNKQLEIGNGKYDFTFSLNA